MNILNKYIGIYILENKYELEKLLKNIDITKDKINYEWAGDINKDEIIETFYKYYDTGIVELDTMLHYTHLKDNSLREKTYIFVAYYRNKRIIFNSGVTVDIDDTDMKPVIFRKIYGMNIKLEALEVHKIQDDRKGNRVSSIYISYLDVEEGINYKNMLRLKEEFKQGFIEKTIKMKVSKIKKLFI